MSARESFFIGTLAEEAGVSTDAIRFYEEEGVLPEPDRSDSGYRVYGPDDVDRLRFVRQAQGLGLKLDEVRDVLDLVADGVRPCGHVADRLRTRRDEVEARIADLRELRDRLDDALVRAEAAPAGGACRCRIIEGESDDDVAGGHDPGAVPR